MTLGTQYPQALKAIYSLQQKTHKTGLLITWRILDAGEEKNINCEESDDYPRILEWVAYISSPGDLPDPGLEAGVSCIAGTFFTAEPPRKPRKYYGNKWPNWKLNELS